MGWEKESKKWLKGPIPGNASQDDVIAWLRNDELWKKHGEYTPTPGRGNHFAKIKVVGMSHFLKRWGGDRLDLSIKGGYVEKWIIEQLVKAYEQMQTIED